LIILLAHFLAFLIPSGWAVLLGRPLRLYILEVTGLALGISTLIAVSLLIFRRITNARVAAVTTVIDWLVLATLLLQVATGVYIAFTLRWGSVWYLHTATPWLWSLIKLDPQLHYLAALPFVVKLHAFNAFLILALFPFSRLVHVVSVPLTYLARPYQVVIWYRQRRAD
jgi:nitrate reductase gamma subunit